MHLSKPDGLRWATSRQRSCFVIACCLVSLASTEPLRAQETGGSGAATTSGTSERKKNAGMRLTSGSVSQNGEMGSGASMDFTVDEPDSSESTQDGSGEWLIAPVPGYSPVLGATLAAVVAKIYRPAGTTKDSPAWITGGGVFGAQNGSWGVGLAQKMNLDNDRWRITAAAAYADVRYRYYGIGNDEGDLDRYVPLRQKAPIATAKVMYQVGTGWYVGAKIVVADSTISLDPEDLPPGFGLPPGWGEADEPFDALLAGVVPTIEYDSRDSEFFPRHGVLFSAQGALFSESIGSDFDFQIYTLAYNHYLPMGDRGVLALRGYARVGAGDVPFFALSTLGQGSDIRGYTPGRYRDNALVAGQVEYRYELSESWCLAAFAGVGAVGPSIGDIPRGLPAGGLGVRYRLAKENKVSLRVDAAWGRDDSAFYLSVGEAF